MKILAIEDEYKIADAIQARLQREGYDVEMTVDGDIGRERALDGVYDLIILDVMLPGLDGFTILKDLKDFNITSKVIMLTARSDIDDKLLGFDFGADDYLTKPFHMDELVARINVLLKRASNANNELLFGDIKLDLNNLQLVNQTNAMGIEVVGKEFQLLSMLIENQNQLMAKEIIFNKIWGVDSESNLSCVETYISFLRKKLKAIEANTNIRSVRNMGYRLELRNEKDPE